MFCCDARLHSRMIQPIDCISSTSTKVIYKSSAQSDRTEVSQTLARMLLPLTAVPMQICVYSLRPFLHWKLILKVMQISSFRKKIFIVNNQINFEIIFCNLEHVLFCEILQKKFPLWSAVIGQSASVYKHRMKYWQCCLNMAFKSVFPVWKCVL